MSSFARSCRDDAGFSLSELLIVVMLIGMVLSGAYALSYTTTATSRESEARGTMARDTAQPLQLAEKYLMQALALEVCTPNRLVYRLDRDLTTSGTGERQTLEVTADGKLLLTSVQIDAAFNPVSAPRTATLSTHVANVASGTPLFRYYDSGEVEITLMGYVSSRARSILVTLDIREDEDIHSDSRLITLRNRE